MAWYCKNNYNYCNCAFALIHCRWLWPTVKWIGFKNYIVLSYCDNYLSFSSDPVLIKLRVFTSDAVELFEVLIANVLKFRDRIDEIIVIYYKFLNLIYGIIKAYYKRKSARENNKNNNK